MKLTKISILTALLAVFFVGCKDDTVTPGGGDGNGNGTSSITVVEENMAIMNKLTATWCGPCGQWGWDLNEAIIADNYLYTIPMGTYGSSTSVFFNPAADKFKKDFAPTAGWPAFCVNGVNETEYAQSGGIYTGQTQTNCLTACLNHAQADVVANAGYNVKIENDVINIDVKTKFFQEGTGTYKVGAYVLEDKALAVQNGKTGVVEHHHVLQAAASADVYGKEIASTSAGSTFETSFAVPLNGDWNKDNLEYAVIIWKVNGAKHEFVNAYQKR